MSTTTVVTQPRGLGFLLLRIVYFLFLGLWLSGVWSMIAWVFSVTIIGLPIGLWMLNRLPQISTLKPERQNLVITTTGESYTTPVNQQPFFVRAIYFLLVGWWFSAMWLSAAWLLSTTVIGIPFAFWMIDRVPAIITLARM
jgi:uncharacterized membrane protein YccF (DUF307 family)